MDQDEPSAPRSYGMGKGKVFPASEAKSLLNPLRRWVQSPGRTVAATSVSSTDRVLEIGSGPGFFTPHLAQAVAGGGHVVALDLQWEMATLAQDRCRPHANASFVQGDAAVLPFADGWFDAVFIATVLGEVPDRTGFLCEVRRVLRVGGVLAISETRRDSDFVGFDALRSDVQRLPFEFRRRAGHRWQYVATFAAT